MNFQKTLSIFLPVSSSIIQFFANIVSYEVLLISNGFVDAVERAPIEHSKLPHLDFGTLFSLGFPECAEP